MSDSDENVPTKTKKSAERHVRRRKKRHRKERKSRDKSEASEPEVEVEIEEAFESGNRWPLMLTLVALAFFGLVAYAVWPATELPVRSVVDIDVATGGEKESTEAVSTESQGETLEYSSESIRSQLGSQAGSQQEPGSESNKESFDTINPENIEADWIDYSMPDSISEQEPEPEVDSDFFDSEDIEDFKENAEDVISEENLINEENFENAVDAEEHGEFDKNFERNIESSFFGLWQRGDIRKEAVEVSPAPEVVHYSDELEERLLTARSIVDSMAKEEKAAGNVLHSLMFTGSFKIKTIVFEKTNIKLELN